MWRRTAAGLASAIVAMLAAVSHAQAPAATPASQRRTAEFLEIDSKRPSIQRIDEQ